MCNNIKNTSTYTRYYIITVGKIKQMRASCGRERIMELIDINFMPSFNFPLIPAHIIS